MGIAMFFFDQTARYAPILLSAGLGILGYKYKEISSAEKTVSDVKKIT